MEDYVIRLRTQCGHFGVITGVSAFSYSVVNCQEESFLFIFNTVTIKDITSTYFNMKFFIVPKSRSI